MDYKAIIDGLVEQLAAIEHERWSHWQKYMHSKATKQPDGSMVVPAELVARWEKQMSTDYADLSDGEKTERSGSGREISAPDRQGIAKAAGSLRAILAQRRSGASKRFSSRRAARANR